MGARKVAEEGTALVTYGADQWPLKPPGPAAAAVIGQHPATDAAPLTIGAAQTDCSGSSSGQALVVRP